jgi:hypothetical protein
MNDARRDFHSHEDFLREMLLAVEEETQLYALPYGVVDKRANTTVERGPWIPAECSAVMLSWFDHGLVMLYLPSEPEIWAPGYALGEWMSRAHREPYGHVLAPGDARELLSNHALWVPARIEGLVCVAYRDGAAADLPSEQWYDAAPPVTGAQPTS